MTCKVSNCLQQSNVENRLYKITTQLNRFQKKNTAYHQNSCRTWEDVEHAIQHAPSASPVEVSCRWIHILDSMCT